MVLGGGMILRFSVVLGDGVVDGCWLVINRGSSWIDWCRLLIDWCRLLIDWCRLVIDWCRLVIDWCRLMIDWFWLVIDWCSSGVCWCRSSVRLINFCPMGVRGASYGDLDMAAGQGRTEGQYGEK